MNIKKIIVGATASAVMFAAMVIPAFAKGGFDANGYNTTARLFNGTLLQWCTAKSIDPLSCPAYGFGSNNDKIVMKWNAAWDACNLVGNTDPTVCAGAWTDNEWNGNAAGGSGFVWHYKIVWVGDYASNPSLLTGSAYGIWGEYAVIMDQGVDPNTGHQSFALGSPAGYGAYK